MHRARLSNSRNPNAALSVRCADRGGGSKRRTMCNVDSPLLSCFGNLYFCNSQKENLFSSSDWSTTMALASLPRELLNEIASHLSNSDLGEWRLACKRFSLVPLHIDRVFISANPRDIEVFRAIADHETQRYTVKEIVWNEGRFEEDPRRTWCRPCTGNHRPHTIVILVRGKIDNFQ